MANLIVDLWPEDIGVAEDMVSPASVLREQAALLGQKTKNLVQAEARMTGESKDAEFAYSFYLLAPAMGSYRFHLFYILHPLDFYPLKFGCDYVEPTVEIIASEEGLLRKLRDVFAAEKTVRVIKAIIAQSKE